MPVDLDKIANDLAYRELYLKYLGTLRVLGEAAARVREDHPERDSIDTCMEDAARFLEGRVVIRRVMPACDIQSVSTAEVEDDAAPADDGTPALDPRAL
jgi:hypothetical protein